MTSGIITFAPARRYREEPACSDGGTAKVLLVAGLAGGIAEILWVALYSQWSSLSAADVSRQVVLTVFPAAAGAGFAPLLGIAIHLALSVMLALVLGPLWLPIARRQPPFVIAIAAATLVVVWGINFFLVLPHVNPAFATLMPYPITFASKLLFGLAAGLWLYRAQRTRLASITLAANDPSKTL